MNCKLNTALIKEYVRGCGMNKKELAKACGMSLYALNRLMQGATNLRATALAKFSIYFKIKVQSLFVE